MHHVLNQAAGDNWTLYHGDCVQVIQGIPDNSIHFGIHSPPFSSLYVYSDSVADMGNCASDDEFFEHYTYLISELLRTTAAGRLCAVHCKDLPRYATSHGQSGLYDFPGAIIRAFESAQTASDASARWQYHSRVTIWKDPVIEASRTNSHGLLHKNFSERAEVVRQGMPDYILVFRKWCDTMQDKQVQQRREPGDYIGQNAPHSYQTQRDYSIAVWQRYASPVWFDIDQTNVLNFQLARDSQDEKHICPLQLDVIARCVDLWTNAGEVVFSPFAGIGSEGYEALKLGRKFVGIELKQSYFDIAVRNLTAIEFESSQPTLFDLAVPANETVTLY